MPDNYSSDRAQADRALKATAEFILNNVRRIHVKDRKRKKENEVRRIHQKLIDGFSPVDWERRIIDEAYETVMAVAGLASVEVHEDRRRRSLRFGHQ